MTKILYCFLALAFLISDAAYSLYYDKDIPVDFKGMLLNPTASLPKGASLEATMVQPFAQKRRADVDLFSNPRNFQSASPQKAAIDVLSTEGRIMRGVLSHGNTAYNNISTAAAEGVINIFNGALGFSNVQATVAQEEMMARNLLAAAHAMGSDAVSKKITQFERVYNSLSDRRQKQHLQISAMLMLMGSSSLGADDGWYRNNIDVDSVNKKFQPYIEEFTNLIFAEEASAGVLAPTRSDNLMDLEIAPLRYKEKPQSTLYGTPGIKASALHATVTGARYPAGVMVLGSHRVPTFEPQDMFSITAELAPNHYFIIMQPTDVKDPVLRPHYMQIYTDPKTAEGSGRVDLSVDDLLDTPKTLTIDWKVARQSSPFDSKVEPTRKVANDGSLKDVIGADDKDSYTFVASTVGSRGGAAKYFYWSPTTTQMKMIKDFAKNKKGEPFALGELINELKTKEALGVAESSLLTSLLVDKNLESFWD